MNINNSSSSYDNNVYNLIKKSIDAASMSSKVTANNIANVNTKGYKRYYVSFQDAIKEETDNLALKTEDQRHMGDSEDNSGITVKQDTTSSMNADGNNVDIDSEMSDLAANTLMYNAMITQINSKLASSRLVINGGR
jgi:flagellar basal-body rod protein FlgB